jgi:hypothetical protein
MATSDIEAFSLAAWPGDDRVDHLQQGVERLLASLLGPLTQLPKTELGIVRERQRPESSEPDSAAAFDPGQQTQGALAQSKTFKIHGVTAQGSPPTRI